MAFDSLSKFASQRAQRQSQDGEESAVQLGTQNMVAATEASIQRDAGGSSEIGTRAGLLEPMADILDEALAMPETGQAGLPKNFFKRLLDPVMSTEVKLALAVESSDRQVAEKRQALAVQFLLSRREAVEAMSEWDRRFVESVYSRMGMSRALSESQSALLFKMVKQQGWRDPDEIEERRVVLATDPIRSGSDVRCWVALELTLSKMRLVDRARALLFQTGFKEVAIPLADEGIRVSNTLVSGESVGDRAGGGQAQLRVDGEHVWLELGDMESARVSHDALNVFYWSGSYIAFFQNDDLNWGEDCCDLVTLYEGELRQSDEPGEYPVG
jgi:hypothetical protein